MKAFWASSISMKCTFLKSRVPNSISPNWKCFSLLRKRERKEMKSFFSKTNESTFRNICKKNSNLQLLLSLLIGKIILRQFNFAKNFVKSIFSLIHLWRSWFHGIFSLYLEHHLVPLPYYRVYWHSILNAKILGLYWEDKFYLSKYLAHRLPNY